MRMAAPSAGASGASPGGTSPSGMTGFTRLLVNASSMTVGLSGAVYAFMKYLMAGDEPFSAFHHPLQPWMLDLHVISSPLLVFTVGMIAREHILAQLQKGPGRRGRGTGVMAVACLLPMIATGYLIQVFVDERALLICIIVHLVTSAVYLAAFIAHLAISRKIAALRRTAQENGATTVWNGQSAGSV